MTDENSCNDILKKITDILSDHKAKDIVYLDIKGRSVMADYFVIATAQSLRHLYSLSETLIDSLTEANLRGREGDMGSDWILLDYGDVIVHVFTEEARRYYDLQRIWADAEVTKIN